MGLGLVTSGVNWCRAAKGPIPLQLHLLRILPASGCNRSQGMSSGMSRRQSWNLPVILALWPEESKGQNDLSEMLHYE